MEPDPANRIAEAKALLDERRNDAAIERLRSRDAPNDAPRCALLARAYFQRGDTRGDVFACHFFAARALSLGMREPAILAMAAISSFRKERYDEAARLFGEFATVASPAATQFMFGIALLRAGRPGDALPWLERARGIEPGNASFSDAVREAAQVVEGRGEALPGRMWTRAEYGLGGPDEQRPPGVDSPYAASALSKLKGIATRPKDYHWLEQNIPCQKACPAGTDVPEYLSAIYRGEYDRAYRVNLHDNVFPAILGRVCSRPCEAACRHGWEGLGEPVAICFSKRSAADFKNQDLVTLDAWFPPSGKRVAVVGAGVAGLAVARNLALCGHRVTVYEKHHRPGGMLNQGIPEFRLPRDVIDQEVEQVRRQGVRIVCNAEIGGTLSVDDLLRDADALVLAAGTLRPNLLNLPGRELEGIRHGLDFLLEVSDRGAAEVGRQVVVIGGGFTAMDCARTAQRLGAGVVELELETDRRGRSLAMRMKGEAARVYYRRSRSEMLVTPGELEELQHEGIPMHFMVSPVAYLGEKGRVRAMRFVRTELGEPDASGRRRPVEVPGSEFEIPADTVLLATGQFPATAFIRGAARRDLVGPDGWLRGGKSVRTSVARVFAAGDFATGATTLIEAIAHAKQCARAVDRFLMGTDRLQDVAVIEDARHTGRIREMDFVARRPMPSLPLNERTLVAEVERGYAPEQAVDETQRCYLCHYKYEIDPDRCIYCDWCIKVKPRPECIVNVSSLIYDEQGRMVGHQKAPSSETTKRIWINQADCIRCGACVEACPVDAISIQKVSLKTVRTGDRRPTI